MSFFGDSSPDLKYYDGISECLPNLLSLFIITIIIIIIIIVIIVIIKIFISLGGGGWVSSIMIKDRQALTDLVLLVLVKPSLEV